MDIDIGAIASLLLLAGAAAGLVGGAWLAWTHAPPVGGEFWPYIRAAVAIIAAVIGAKVGMIAIALAAFLFTGVMMVLEVLA